jgi:two-component system, NtrC family, response regulator PilR
MKENKTDEYMNLVGSSEEMLRIYEMIEILSKTSSNVLVTGESGTGKELVAKAIHNRSDRKEKPFVIINCGAIPENLMESEMFGHKKSSFTDAINDKVGLFEIANKGTIFLDEVSELPAHMQVKLLRVIQEKTIRKIGDVKNIHIDVRIIAASNQNLDKKVIDKEFREDLYYRLNVIELDILPLRKRREDIPILINHFIKKYSKKLNKSKKILSKEVKNKLMHYPFYGNVRELENIVERFISLSKNKIIKLQDLPKKIIDNKLTEESYKLSIPKNNLNKTLDLEKITTNYEKDLIQKALDEANGIKTKAAKYLGISFRSLRYRLKKYNIN